MTFQELTTKQKVFNTYITSKYYEKNFRLLSNSHSLNSPKNLVALGVLYSAWGEGVINPRHFFNNPKRDLLGVMIYDPPD